MNAETRREIKGLDQICGLTKKVGLFFYVKPDFIGVHRLEAPTFGCVFGGSNAIYRIRPYLSGKSDMRTKLKPRARNSGTAAMIPAAVPLPGWFIWQRMISPGVDDKRAFLT